MSVRMLRQLAKRADLDVGTTTPDDQIERNGSDILRTWYHEQTYRNRTARDVVTILFALGFLLVSIPSLVSAVKIAALLLR